MPAPRPPQPRPQARAIVALAVAAAVITAAAPRSAHAQFWPEITEQQKKGRLRLGSLALTPRLELRNAGVDTNVFVTETNPTKDTAVVLRAASDAYLPMGRRVRAAGTVWLDLNYFASESDQRSTDPGGQGRLELDAWRLTFVGGGGGFRTRDLYWSDVDQRVRRTEGWVNGGARLRLSSTVSAEGGLEKRQYRWYPTDDQSPTIREELDRDATDWKGGLRWKVTPLTTIVGSVERIEDRFLYSLPGQETTLSYRYLGGFEFGRKAFLSGLVLAGVRDIPADQAGSVEPYTGPAAQVALTAPLLHRLRVNLGYSRDVYYSAEGGYASGAPVRNTFTYGRLGGSLDVDTAFDLVVRLTLGRDTAHYLRPFAVGDGSIDRTDHLLARGVSVLRRIGDNALFGFSALYTSRSTNFPNGNYDRWQYGVQGVLNP